jgi:hypothetical protein
MLYVWELMGGISDAATTGASDAPVNQAARHSNTVRKSIGMNDFITTSSGS